MVDKTDEISTPKAERSTGIIFKNIELPEPDKQSDGTVNLPGLGLDNEMLDILNEGSSSLLRIYLSQTSNIKTYFGFT